MAEQLGLRKNGAFKAVCTAPSINKTPVGSAVPPLPYPVQHDLTNAVAVVPKVRYNGDPACVLSQTTQPSCTGDAAGSVGGTKSGTVSGEVKPTSASRTVNAGKKKGLRAGDPCTLNNGNCPGLYLRAPPPNADASAAKATGTAPVQAQPKAPVEKSVLDRAVDAVKSAAQKYQDEYSRPLHDLAGSAMEKGATAVAAGEVTAGAGGPLSLTGPGAVVGVPMVAVGGVATAAGGVATATGALAETAASALDAASHVALTIDTSALVTTATTYAKNMVVNKVTALAAKVPGLKNVLGGNSKAAAPAKGDKTSGLKVAGSGGGPCKVGPYNLIKDQCPEGQQAHHIIADKFVRTSNRADGIAGKGRIPGMPDFGGGPAICLTGNARVNGTEHHEAHKGDSIIATLGKLLTNGPVDTAPVSEVVPIAMQSAINARPECKQQIEDEVRKSFPDHENDNRSMRTSDQPSKGESKAHLDGGNTSDGNNRSNRSSRKKG